MDAEDWRCVARVRCLALLAQASAGGSPRPGQLARAARAIAAVARATSSPASRLRAAVVKEDVCGRETREDVERVDKCLPWMEEAT